MKALMVVYDNDSYIHYFPVGMAYIASVMRRAGAEIEIWNQDFHHYPDELLTEKLDSEKYDVVCIGVIAGYYQYRKLLGLSDAINRSKNRPIFILGGHGPTPDPAFFIRKTQADIIVLGEGEETIVEVLEAVTNQSGYENIKGIAYKDAGGKAIVNERREAIRDIDTIPYPAYDLFPIHYYRLLRRPHCVSRDFVFPMLSGRGCKFKCNFCYRMDKGIRLRQSGAVVEEIEFLKKNYDISYISFTDELLMSSPERVEDICRAFINANLNVKWYCNGRLNYAKPDVLGLMKKAGCVFINYGIEAVDDQILKNMNKVLTVKQIVSGIEATLSAGISPGFNIIFGNIGENRRTLQKGVDFLLEYDDGAQMRTIRPVTPYPGSDLYYYAIKKGLLRDIEDFYENKHLNSDLLSVNFTDLTDDEFHEALCEANITLLQNYFKNQKDAMIRKTKDLYLNKNTQFRGYRHG